MGTCVYCYWAVLVLYTGNLLHAFSALVSLAVLMTSMSPFHEEQIRSSQAVRTDGARVEIVSRHLFVVAVLTGC